MPILNQLLSNPKIQTLSEPFGWLFGSIVAARKRLYEQRVLKARDLGVPIVSVGNLTVGGTGKTPLVRFVCEVLAGDDHRVCVLTRGYKRQNPNERTIVSDGKQILSDARSAGDEPFELAIKLLNVAAVVADKNRFAAGVWARENLGATAFVLDDGFQHLRLKRDLDIVAVDAIDPFGNHKLLPAGTLREPLTGLQRVDCVVVTRADLVEKSQVSNLKSEISKFTNCPILTARTQIVGLAELDAAQPNARQRGELQAISQEQKARRAFAFCALGNPANFYQSLRLDNFRLAATRSFPDHHVYTAKDVEAIHAQARESGAEILLTTAKDAVKLFDFKFDLPCFVVEIETVFDHDAPLRELLKRINRR